VKLDMCDENIVIICWFNAKNCIFEHMTDKTVYGLAEILKLFCFGVLFGFLTETKLAVAYYVGKWRSWGSLWPKIWVYTLFWFCMAELHTVRWLDV